MLGNLLKLYRYSILTSRKLSAKTLFALITFWVNKFSIFFTFKSFINFWKSAPLHRGNAYFPTLHIISSSCIEFSRVNDLLISFSHIIDHCLSFASDQFRHKSYSQYHHDKFHNYLLISSICVEVFPLPWRSSPGSHLPGAVQVLFPFLNFSNKHNPLVFIRFLM